MNPALVDVLDWVEELRQDLRERLCSDHLPPGPKITFDWAACGTAAQYRKHLRHGIPPCRACKQAENRRYLDNRAKRNARGIEKDFGDRLRAINLQLNGLP